MSGIRLIRVMEVVELTGLSSETIYRYGRRHSPEYDPAFPQPVKLGARAVAWIEKDVVAWVLSRVQAKLAAKPSSPFADSYELAAELRVIAKKLRPMNAYYLREAAESLEGMWRLVNQ